MHIILWYSLQALMWCFIAAVIHLLTSGYCPSYRRYRLIQKLPGPKGWPIFGNALEMKNLPIENLLEWLSKKLENYDRMMRLWITFVSNIYLIDPEDIQVLFNNTQYINKGLEYNVLKSWLDEGLLTSSGDKWHSRRKLLTPAFHFKILEDNLSNFNRNAKTLARKFQEAEGKEIDIESYLTLCTLDIIMGTAMGVQLDSQKGDIEYVSHLKRITQLITQRIMRPQLYLDWMFYLSETGRQFRKTVSYLHHFSNRVIKERKLTFSDNVELNKIASNNNKVHRAFLDKMLEYESKNPGSFTDKDLREEVDTFMFEGHDTTSAALKFIFFNIARYSDIQEKIHSELDEIFGDSDRDTTTDDLNKMIYLEKVIKESLRLYPSVPAVTRLLEKDLILKDGVTLPANANIIASIFHVHRNTKYWDEPDKFDPERFNEEQIQNRHPYAYIPFSAGARNCIGQRFALMELKTVASTVLRQLKIEPVSTSEDFKLMLFLILRTNKPVKCRFISKRINKENA